MIHLMGIRHHGPGSARSVLAALQRLQPDCILIEGPSDADALIEQLADPAFQPPVALMLHTPIQKQQRPQAVFYPFAEFSPEWQAMRYAVQQSVTVRFIDLPQQIQFALVNQREQQAAEAAAQAEADLDGDAESTDSEEANAEPLESTEQPNQNPAPYRADPIGLLAQAAGYQDSERFWEHLVEQQPHAGDVFDLLGEAMQAVREQVEADWTTEQRQSDDAQREQLREQLREAWMRKSLREAEKAGFKNIAVICGAWHVPALQDLKTTRKADTELLKGLPKTKTEASWIAWTHQRLARDSGYGAGIEAVGWYAHLWKHYQRNAAQHGGAEQPIDAEAISIDWLSQCAHALRSDGQDVSSAQVIDAVQLIQAMLVLRGRQLPDLDDLQDAIVSVLNHGQVLPQPVLDRLLQDQRLGRVPEGCAQLPLQQDFAQQVKHFRLKLEAVHKSIELDLRVPFDLQKSQFLHQLSLLGLSWGKIERASNGRGNFKEAWTLSWQPEDALQLNEMAMWGGTVLDAAHAWLTQMSTEATQIQQLAAQIEQSLLAGLQRMLPAALARLDTLSAQQHDPILLIDALTPLVNAARYGSVRAFDTAMLIELMQRLLARIVIGLPLHCQQLNDDVAAERIGQLAQLFRIVELSDQAEFLTAWQQLLTDLLAVADLQGRLAGWCCRMAREQDLLSADEAKIRFSRALSVGQNPEHSAAWFEGFITDQALLLLHDDGLWELVDQWLLTLPAEQFIALLPLLRRTTASFAHPERQQLAQRASQQQTSATSVVATGFDAERAAPSLQILVQWLTLPIDSAGVVTS